MERQINLPLNISEAYEGLQNIREHIKVAEEYHLKHPGIGGISRSYASRLLGDKFSGIVLSLDPSDPRFTEALEASVFYDRACFLESNNHSSKFK